jgi:23S rRNA (pseudouridine1915-N3)-methyltransferase
MIKIICIGKKHDQIYEPALTHFEKRLGQRQKVEWLILSPSGDSGNTARDEESNRLLDKINPGDYVILLDETGKNSTSPELASYIEKAQNNSRQIVCLIGGAYGVNAGLKARVDEIIAFGQVVFPHQLIRVMLLEQLYRAYSINNGSGYHHE